MPYLALASCTHFLSVGVSVYGFTEPSLVDAVLEGAGVVVVAVGLGPPRAGGSVWVATPSVICTWSAGRELSGVAERSLPKSFAIAAALAAAPAPYVTVVSARVVVPVSG